MRPWRTLARQTVLQNRWLTLEHHTIGLPDGRQLPDWLWMIVPDYVNVLVQTSAGEFLVFRQTKYAVDGLTLALVGGMIDAGETPIMAAQRELKEEMGGEAAEWIFLGQYATDANRGVGVGYLYLARGVTLFEKAYSDDLEEQEMVCLSSEALREAYLSGEFKVMSWAATVGLALAHITR